MPPPPRPGKKALMMKTTATSKGKKPAAPVVRASGLTARAQKLHELALEYHAAEQKQQEKPEAK